MFLREINDRENANRPNEPVNKFGEYVDPFHNVQRRTEAA